jgi:hypothetical protein
MANLCSPSGVVRCEVSMATSAPPHLRFSPSRPVPCYHPANYGVVRLDHCSYRHGLSRSSSLRSRCRCRCGSWYFAPGSLPRISESSQSAVCQTLFVPSSSVRVRPEVSYLHVSSFCGGARIFGGISAGIDVFGISVPHVPRPSPHANEPTQQRTP